MRTWTARLARRRWPGIVCPAMPGGSAMRTFVRLAAFYVATFAALGVYMQYFPVWLQRARGLGPEGVTTVLSGQIWARTLAGPLWAQCVDRTGRARAVLAVLALLSLLAMLAFVAAQATGTLLLCSIAFGCAFPPQFAITDGFAVHCAAEQGFAYPRVRMWGSISFLCLIVAVGDVLRRASALPPGAPAGAAAAVTPDAASLVWWFLAAGLALAAATAFFLPATRMPVASGRAPVGRLLRQPQFLLFLLASGLIGGSHAAYYALSTLHWQGHGMGADVAGWLWAEGIVAEIAVFFWLRRLPERLRPTTMMLLGAGCAAVRWAVIGCTTAPLWIALVNWMHAGSFGLLFLGSLRFIRTRIASELQATAQGLLGAASSGVCTALATHLSGRWYRSDRGDAFFAMCGFAVLGGALTWCLRRRRAPA
jgi:PPP family 3-phenylpropionic acid transporter